MKSFKFLILFISVWLTGSHFSSAYGQTFGQTFYCVDYSTAAGGGPFVQVTFSLPAAQGTILTTNNPVVSPELGSTAPTINNTTNPRTMTLTVNCAQNSRCPGKVRVLYGDPACPKGVDVPVYKNYTQANLNSFSQFVFGVNDISVPNPYAIIADGCADPGQLINLAVVPVVSTLPCSTVTDTYTWRFVDAAGNPIAAWTPLTASGDNSSITLRVPSAANFTQPCTVQVRVGNCAAANVVHAQLIIRPNASPVDISIVSGSTGTRINPQNPNSISVAAAANLGGTFGDRTWCLNADYGFLLNGQLTYTSDQFTLQALPDESATGVTYTWTVPVGFTIVSQTNNQITLRAGGGSLGTSGEVSVSARTTSTCRPEVARFTITRRLVAQTGNVAAGTVNFNLPTVTNPAASLPTFPFTTPAPTACNPAVNPQPLEVRQDYIMTVPNVPANTPINWSCTPGVNPFWEFRPNPSAKESTIYATNINTSGSTVIARYRIPVGYTNTVPFSPIINISGGTCSSTLQFIPNIKLPGTIRLALDNVGSSNPPQNNNVLRVTNASGAPAWPLGTPCNASNVNYYWSFQGSFEPLLSTNPDVFGPVQQFSGTEYERNLIFNVNNVLGQNSQTLQNGRFNGTFRVAVHNGASVCGNCFGAEASLQVNTYVVKRPSGGGGNDGQGQSLDFVPKLYLSPNPASKEVDVRAEGLEDGRLQILNSSGIPVYEQNHVQNHVKVPTNALPKGIYSVEYLDKNGKRATEKLLIQ